jgi:hypothetical protein
MKYADIFVGLAALAVVLWAAIRVSSSILSEAAGRRKASHDGAADADRQKQLALHAPQALSGVPLLDVIIQQGAELSTADALFAHMVNDINTLLPTETQQQVADWQKQHRQSKR